MARGALSAKQLRSSTRSIRIAITEFISSNEKGRVRQNNQITFVKLIRKATSPFIPKKVHCPLLP
ncbi:hypothetical protein DFAR_210005 [Desulfarculales bacterium]